MGGPFWVRVSLAAIERLFTEGVKEAGERARTAGAETITRMNAAITKKESSSQYLADLQKIRKAYVQDVKENYSDNRIPHNEESVNRIFAISSEKTSEILYSIDDATERGESADVSDNEAQAPRAVRRGSFGGDRDHELIFIETEKEPPFWCGGSFLVWERKEKAGFIELFDGHRYYVFRLTGAHTGAPLP